MAGAMRKAAVYLGLVEDENYDGYDEYYDDSRDARHEGARSEGSRHEVSGQSQAIRQERSGGHDRSGSHDTGRQHAEVTPISSRRPVPVSQVVRDVEVGGMNRITTIHPRTYNEAKNIGEWFRDQVPVIMNLSEMEDADAKRLVDFAAGLVFGLHGSIERVTAKVFLLTPAHVEVSADEPEAPGDKRAFFNQS